MFHKVSTNDVALCASLAYLCFDVAQEWAQFDTCHKPVHTWFLVSCIFAVGFRLARLLASLTHHNGDNEATHSSAGTLGELLLFDIRDKGPRSRTVVNLTWMTVMPFFALWSLIGAHWLLDVIQQTPRCMPEETHVWFLGFWVFLCNVWSIVHACLGYRLWCAIRQMRLVEANILLVEDEETLRRWGAVRPSDTLDPARRGLDPEQIKALPCETACGCTSREGELECSICLSDVCEGESFRRLPRCGHTFHRSCIDLWLVRNAECPLCKQHVA